MKRDRVLLAKIDLAGSIQVRVGLNDAVVGDYKEAMEAGTEFPPVVLFQEGETYFVGDGFHRITAAQQTGAREIAADVRKGGKEDALRHSLSANAAHGLRRTNADKRRSVKLGLEHWSNLSDRKLAEICATSHNFVNEMRGVSSDDSRTQTQRRRPSKIYAGAVWGVFYRATPVKRAALFAEVFSMGKKVIVPDKVRFTDRVERWLKENVMEGKR